jgi:hypothetical protein
VSGRNGRGLAIETATAHVEVAVVEGRDTVRAHRVEEVGHGTRGGSPA